MFHTSKLRTTTAEASTCRAHGRAGGTAGRNSANTASRDVRWAKLLCDGASADDAAVLRATERLAQALPAVKENVAIATAARAEEHQLRAGALRLRAELDRRTSTAAGHGPVGKDHAPEATVGGHSQARRSPVVGSAPPGRARRSARTLEEPVLAP